MRFIEITMLLLMINLSITFFNQTGMVGNNNQYLSTESIDNQGNITETNLSVAYRIQTFYNDKSYINPGVQGTTQQYLQSGGDFIRAWSIFQNVFLGTFLLVPTLINLGVPPEVAYYFLIPYLVLYALAVVEFFSGRSVMPE